MQLARAAARLSRASGLPPLVLMTDDERLPDPLAAARALPQGSLVILRARQVAHRAKLASALMPIARARRFYVSIAGDPALAARIGAHGLHLPEARAHEAAHWRGLRPRWLITVSGHSLRASSAARYADATIVSPIYPTQSHSGRVALGALRLAAFARTNPRPLYALGGLTAQNARRLKGTRIAGLAAIGALAA